MNTKIYVESRECKRAISECILPANFTSRNIVHPETFRTERAISNAPLETKLEALKCCRQDTKEATICIDNKYALIKFTKLNQINHNFSYFFTSKHLM